MVVENTLADKLTKIAIKQIEAGVKFRQPRLKQIRKFEDAYHNKVTKPLKGHFNIPLPIVGGFLDTLKSKIDDPVTVLYKPNAEADRMKAMKVTAALKVESAADKENWPKKDRDSKHLGILSGRAIFRIYSESDPKYKHTLDVLDYNDYYNEPMGGGDTENHAFQGILNVFKTKKSLEAGVKSGLYDATQVATLTRNTSDEEFKKNSVLQQEKFTRAQGLGLDPKQYSFIGENILNLTEHYMEWEGTRYYLLLDYTTGVWVRAEELKDLFKSGKYPIVSWATHPDPFNFWSKSPIDDVYPISEAMRVTFNQGLLTLRKRNQPMLAYDPDVFPDPTKLSWRPDGRVRATQLNGRAISQGVYEFKTDENSTVTINLINYLDNFLGTKTGITAAAQGQGEEDKVAIFEGNLQQVADRLGLLSKEYSDAWSQLGVRYLEGLGEHAPEKMVVKLIGERGVGWDEMTREDINPSKDFSIIVVGGNSEKKAGEKLQRKQNQAINSLLILPEYRMKLNPEFVIEQQLRMGGYTEEEVRQALDTDNLGNRKIISEAAWSVEEIIKGKEPKINRAANSAFVQKILDSAVDLDFDQDNEKDKEIFDNLIAYALEHESIVIENEQRRAQKESQQMAQNLQGQGNIKTPTEEVPVELPGPRVKENV